MRPRSLRIHAKRHAKSQQPAREPLWTEKRVSALKIAVPRTEPFDVTTLGVKSSEELDRAGRTLLTELGKLQNESKRNAKARKNLASSTTKDRIVVGIRQTHRDIVTATPRLILLAKRVESGDSKGTPAEQIQDIVDIAKQRQIPIAAVLSRREVCFSNPYQFQLCTCIVFDVFLSLKQIGKALKPWLFRGKNKGFGVSALLVVRETGANESFKVFMNILESTS